MLEASPDFDFPSAVEAFHGILETRFSWRRKYRRDAPAIQKQLDYVSSSDGRTRPAGDESSVDGDAIEHRKLDSPSQDESFNGIERIEFGSARRNLGKVPTDWRRCSTRALSSVLFSLHRAERRD